MTDQNVLILMSDEHTRRAFGAYGNDQISTPNLDHLASRGVRFGNAYCNDPICVPSRAAMATGRYPHDIQTWDNGRPYTGATAQSWGHRLTDHGVDIVTIGKLHYADAADPTGFPDQRVPLHVHNGVGNPTGLLRGSRPPTTGGRDFILEAGPGETEYYRFDMDIADRAVRWFAEEASAAGQWALQVSFVSPHFPLVVPERYFAKYADIDVALPTEHAQESWPHNPALDFHRHSQGNDIPVDDEAIRRATRAYYGLVTFIDEQVGRVLDAADKAGQLDNTVIIYTSDHGEMLGAHGLWKKSTMYEESVGVPLILSGPGLPAGAVNDTNVSLIDIFPTVVQASGASLTEVDASLEGRSLLDIAASGFIDRDVFAEYHDGWSVNAMYMVRDAQHKYIHYTFDSPQVFDLTADPTEEHDLADAPGASAVLSRMEAKLRAIVDPEAVDALAKADQRKRIEEEGGSTNLVGRGDDFRYTPAPAAYAPLDQRRQLHGTGETRAANQ
ncbi:MAG: sulfatase-like hydrolase/transferase [Jatrophihabitans sp.]